jgi:hypothetical protein
MHMQQTTSGAAGNGLYTTIKYLRGTAGIGQGTKTIYMKRTTSGAAGNGLCTTAKYRRGAAGIGLATMIKYLPATHYERHHEQRPEHHDQVSCELNACAGNRTATGPRPTYTKAGVRYLENLSL